MIRHSMMRATCGRVDDARFCQQLPRQQCAACRRGRAAEHFTENRVRVGADIVAHPHCVTDMPVTLGLLQGRDIIRIMPQREGRRLGARAVRVAGRVQPAQCARQVHAAGRFHPQHLGAHIGQQQGGKGAR